LTGNLAVTFLGSYGLKYEVVSIDEQNETAQVHFFVLINRQLHRLLIRQLLVIQSGGMTTLVLL
jgi:hypothetical protein